jgi:hypothetical protein
MKKTAVVLCLLIAGVPGRMFAAIDLAARYADIVTALTEADSKQCGETTGDERGGGPQDPQYCAWQAFRDKKPFTFTRKVAVSIDPKGEWTTFVGRSNGQVFRVIYRADGPLLDVGPCALESSALSGRLICAAPQKASMKPAQVSDDSEYGYRPNKPILIGDGTSGERWLLWHLVDREMKPFSYERLGSQFGSDKHMIDRYALTDSRGNESVIYIDMYHPDLHPINGKAPKGMFLWW